MKFEHIKELEDEKFRRLTGVKKGTFSKMVDILRQADGLRIDFFRNSTSAGDLNNDAVLESVTELEYAAVRGEASPSNPSAQAVFERGLV